MPTKDHTSAILEELEVEQEVKNHFLYWSILVFYSAKQRLSCQLFSPQNLRHMFSKPSWCKEIWYRWNEDTARLKATIYSHHIHFCPTGHGNIAPPLTSAKLLLRLWFCHRAQIWFDQSSVMQSSSLLVPLRAVYQMRWLILPPGCTLPRLSLWAILPPGSPLLKPAPIFPVKESIHQNELQYDLPGMIHTIIKYNIHLI